MQNTVLTGDQITPALKKALGLPADTWQFVINRGFTIASFMDGKCQAHHVEIDDIKRKRAQSSMKPVFTV